MLSGTTKPRLSVIDVTLSGVPLEEAPHPIAGRGTGREGIVSL